MELWVLLVVFLVVSQLLAASGILTNTATAATLIDVLADEVANQRALNGVVPSAVILHPTQLATLRKSKASTSGVFNFDPLSAAPTSVHGVALVPTPSTAAATVLVIAGTSGDVLPAWTGHRRVGHECR